jgi:hypothetical protein
MALEAVIMAFNSLADQFFIVNEAVTELRETGKTEIFFEVWNRVAAKINEILKNIEYN